MKDYQSKANQFQFNAIPFAKAQVLRYCSNNLMEVKYKTSFSEKDWLVVQIKPQSKLRSSKGGGRSQLTMPAKFTIEQKISKEKVNDIKSMLAFMPEHDRNYMKEVISKN
ncbi:hypothetical protein Bpfe_014520 [Biomphalaria pfeifferi]|uniref:Uncharacterized protein n=1 Tax=Biomphalaria pfeifferi TaxID=112525 RepID=A0AAD8FAK6_BIOPF|nr:hypothetical protein Bpfe_014520 [Biomphalaria pfeifferi]